jgi:endonuclease YncB( thermonuclease family)
MKLPLATVIRGEFLIVGKSPDGDSIRFIANNPEHYQALDRSHRIHTSEADQSVQLRFQAIDAPELHYNKYTQPLGVHSRDELLKRMGFRKIQYDGNKVASSSPDRVPGVILSNMVERNGRPVAYLLLEKASESLIDGSNIAIDVDTLNQTLNCQLLAQGVAYPGFYDSIPAIHRQHLQTIAQTAKVEKRGIWLVDRTANFMLRHVTDLTAPSGQLIYPKLFRRGINYLKARANGFEGNFVEWLLTPAIIASGENDRLLGPGETLMQLSDCLQSSGDRVTCAIDFADVMFIER